MERQSGYQSYQLTIQKGFASLSSILIQYINKGIELERISRVAVLLLRSGASKNNPIFRRIKDICLLQQKPDGGWIGVEDTAWAASFLKEFEPYCSEFHNSLKWLTRQQLGSGEWGKTERDTGRIPITGLLLFLLPQLSCGGSLVWLEKEWKKEFSSNPKLTYKGSFFVMGLKSAGYEFADGNLLVSTLDWLACQQNEDCGWGPWNGHPVGSTPFCTGVALTGLLQYPDKVDQQVIVNGLKWIENNQLKDGLWPDHYIEEGSAWCFYALTQGYKFLKER